jgi:hypothetical protein
MSVTAEIEKNEAPVVTEHPEEFPETIQQVASGAQVVQKNFKTQVTNDQGTPIIQTPPTQVVTTIQPPSDQETLLQQSKGDTTNAITWLAAFWLRIIKKALYFGWRIVGHGPTKTSN